jgi:hypothetical protein
MTIKIPVNENVKILFPESCFISVLPRKKKKALKKKLARELIDFITLKINENENNGPINWGI